MSTECDNDDLQLQLTGLDAEIERIDDLVKDLLAQREEIISKQKTLKFKLLTKEKQAKAPTNLEGRNFPWSAKLDETLESVFGIKELRPLQLQTMNALLSKQDCILIMPTGGGKSICFQLPALLADGVTLVISPLISLMEDQIMGLKGLSVNAEMIHSGIPRKTQNGIMKGMIDCNSAMKILYVTPERLKKSKRFMSYLEKMHKMGRFSHLAVDEVHCCSQWGHDFRPDYKFLGLMKQLFPDVPILGLTATATTSVNADVQKMLQIENCHVFRASFNRPNLKYTVVMKPTSQKEMITLLANLIHTSYRKQSGIVYCFSIKESEDVASGLVRNGIEARTYHANLCPKLRSEVHREWLSDKCQVVVATVAFGMGIDKPNVQFVIHHSLSKSIENFYQESGRAGRDGKLADCVLFYRMADIFRNSSMVFEERTGIKNLYGMVSYCIERKQCRRSILADHFSERWDVADCNQMCDNCINKGLSVMEVTDIAEHCHVLLSLVCKSSSSTKGLTGLKLMDAWLAESRSGKRLATPYSKAYSKPKLSRSDCERILAHLLVEGYLKEEFHFTSYTTYSYIVSGPRAAQVMSGQCTIKMDLLKSADPGCRTIPSTSGCSTSEPIKKNVPWIINRENSKCASKSKGACVEEKVVLPKRTESRIHEVIETENSDTEYDFGELHESKSNVPPIVDISDEDDILFDFNYENIVEKPKQSGEKLGRSYRNDDEDETVCKNVSKRLKLLIP